MNQLPAWIDGLRRSYVASAITCANILLFFIGVNLLLAAVFYVRDRGSFAAAAESSPVAIADDGLFYVDGSPLDNGRRSRYQLNWFDVHAYEGFDAAYVDKMLEGFWALTQLGLAYQPWVGFSEPLFESELVNVDVGPRGFALRRTTNPANEEGRPVVRIVTFGGSTTFGYNVADEHTWPSYLSQALNDRARAQGLGIHVEVTNFGRGYYNPSQETALLIDLIKNGHRPNLAIFLDGVNWTNTVGETQDVPPFTDEVAKQVQAMQFGGEFRLTEELGGLPLLRLANALRRRLGGSEAASDEDTAGLSLAQVVHNGFNMFERNREIAKALSHLYGIETLFILQPNPVYNYPLELYRRPLPSNWTEEREQVGMLYARLQPTDRVDLSGLFEEWGYRKAIVDDVHYGPGFNEFLAHRVAGYIDLRDFTPHLNGIEEAAVTGEPRNPPR